MSPEEWGGPAAPRPSVRQADQVVGQREQATSAEPLGSAAVTPLHPPSVEVGPFRVSDSTKEELVDRLISLSLPERSRTAFAYALHVGGLNARRQPDFVAAMRQADVVYADGGSVVWLAKLAGAQHIERAPTTDIGWDLFRGFSRKVGRLPRVAMIGGPPGLARRTGDVFEAAGVADIVLAQHGFQDDWSGPLSRLRAANPDITCIGLGAPREMMWTQRYRDDLPPGLVLTCGGWFGHVVGDERRAPLLLRRSGLEWIARVAQQPVRLGPRYARGLGVTVALALSTRPRRLGTTEP
jgi:N-acetylglucosaminyldiphosphoundecaprenol N-acetyl-beta-D-mannosaminyltransferase